MPRNSRPAFIVEVPFEGPDGRYELDVYGTFVPPERGDYDTPEVKGHYEISKITRDGARYETDKAEEQAVEDALEALVEHSEMATHRQYLQWTREHAHEDVD